MMHDYTTNSAMTNKVREARKLIDRKNNDLSSLAPELICTGNPLPYYGEDELV